VTENQTLIAVSAMIGGAISSISTAITMKRADRARISKLERWKADVENHMANPSKIREIEGELRDIRERAAEIEQLRQDASTDRSEVWRALRSIRHNLQQVSESLNALEVRYGRST